jgi:hypothetical protein
MNTFINAVFLSALLAAPLCGASSVHGRTLRVSANSGSLKTLLDVELDTKLHSESEENASARMLASKPIRIVRGGGKEQKGGKENYEHTHVGDASCDATVKTNSASDKSATCSDACPFYAQDKTDDDFCTFRCVQEKDCQNMNPKTPIGDSDMGVCRSCVVEGCKRCHPTAMDDTCDECNAGYNLVDGKCSWKYTKILQIILGVLGCIFAIPFLWFVDMCIRPAANEIGLKNAMKNREAQKLKMDKDETGRRPDWPLSTNLCKELVAGPGMILHFNFQAAIIVWAGLVALTWFSMAMLIDDKLLILGTRAFGTPRENCILVAWGFETQKRLMWTKVLFLKIVYIGSCVLHFFHCVMQLRRFQAVDFENKTMKDYVAMIEGMPAISGSENVEEDLKTLIAEKSGVPKDQIVGVSVAWDFEEVAEDVDKLLKKDLDALEPAAPQLERGDVFYKGYRRWMFKQEQGVFCEEEEDEDEEEQAEGVGSLLSDMSTSPNAFVVFNTEAMRDRAVEELDCGFEIKGQEGCQLLKLECEPDTVQWPNMGHSTSMDKVLRLTAGFGCIFLACFFWAVVFYAPYAYYVMNFNYENGRQPGFAVGMSFSMIVVVGNAIMYEVCARISDGVGFRFKDHREACYMILYTIACMFNVALDFCTTYYTAYLVMVGLGFRTYYGEKLGEIDTFTKQFETYAMQRALAENTFAYAFPSTFLIPFLIEPVVTIALPLGIGMLIVRSHPELQGRAAEEYINSIPLDMGRYADLILDVILGILIFYFPGGYTAKLFAGMAGSHFYIYCFDHWKILRNIPSCNIASMDIDWWSQALLIPCMGMMASCWVFKYQCDPAVVNRLEGMKLIGACVLAFVAHCVVQFLVLVHVVPMFGLTAPGDDDDEEEVVFADIAKNKACTWFTANPIHCLRSKHVHQHSPAMQHFFLGKEHHMKVNKAIGSFFEEDAPVATPREEKA